LPRQLSNYGSYEPGRHHLRAPDSQLAAVWIGKKLDLFDALSQLIEDSQAALQESATIDCRLHALRRAIEEPHAQRVLEIGDGLGDDGTRDGKPLGRLRHVPLLGHSEEHVQISRFEPTADAIRPLHGFAPYLNEYPDVGD
jgi:hypothetical protein